ncbi:hypothetical protein ACVC7V_10675 [Hydrogenophaga sp. A37]|uniref:hypothetical protein n=1 Tax=Hydrogenophaga sp. A37 TaxID=1945864 RepID=UPI0015C55DA1|nr:hypothetical protein [Hydrogenophaga sp. A37]
MLWQSNPRPKPPVTSAPQVPSAEAVRQAALEASWRRDKRVAQRRLLWRWTLWYIQRFYAHVLVALVLIVAAVHFSDRWFVWPLAAGKPIAAPGNVPVVMPAPPPTAPVSLPEQPAPMAAPDWTVEPITLHAARQLGAQTSGATTSPSPGRQTDTLPLKPETWLHSKEP